MYTYTHTQSVGRKVSGRKVWRRKVWGAKCGAQSVGAQIEGRKILGAQSMRAQNVGRKVWGRKVGITDNLCYVHLLIKRLFSLADSQFFLFHLETHSHLLYWLLLDLYFKLA